MRTVVIPALLLKGEVSMREQVEQVRRAMKGILIIRRRMNTGGRRRGHKSRSERGQRRRGLRMRGSMNMRWRSGRGSRLWLSQVGSLAHQRGIGAALQRHCRRRRWHCWWQAPACTVPTSLLLSACPAAALAARSRRIRRGRSSGGRAPHGQRLRIVDRSRRAWHGASKCCPAADSLAGACKVAG